ncbi:MAG: hypothetical protein WEB59_02940 [Thermoanaerobaculia bacterium]
MHAIVAAVAFAVAAFATGGEVGSEYLAVFGAGDSGLWRSEFTISSTAAVPTQLILSFAPDQICPPLTTCHTIADMAPHGTVVLGAPFGHSVGVAYVASLDSTLVPAVLARALDESGRAVDLPVFRLRSLLALNPSTLVLPGAITGQSGRSNLLLANLGEVGQYDGDSVDLKVEVLDADGVALGSRTVSLDFRNSMMLVDVVRWVGVTDLTRGQVVVTKVGGSGMFWAIMPIVRADGNVSISSGSIP